MSRKGSSAFHRQISVDSWTTRSPPWVRPSADSRTAFAGRISTTLRAARRFCSPDGHLQRSFGSNRVRRGGPLSYARKARKDDLNSGSSDLSYLSYQSYLSYDD